MAQYAIAISPLSKPVFFDRGKLALQVIRSMSDIYLFTTRLCPFCLQAKQLLDAKGLVYSEIAVDGNSEREWR